MSRTWIDLFNGPHVHFFQRVADWLGDVVVTARDYRPIPQLVELYDVEASVVGRHGGAGLVGKLQASTERVAKLTEWATGRDIELAVHKHSVEAARVAFGLGIPNVAFVDNEIMVKQNLLVCPLADGLIAPGCMNHEAIARFAPEGMKIEQFDGVMEVANVSDHQPDESVLTRLGLDSTRAIVVLRNSPLLAAYSRHGVSVIDELKRLLERQIRRRAGRTCAARGRTRRQRHAI